MVSSFMVITGLSDPGGHWYLFWSGIGSDLAEFAAIFIFLRHKNCHEHRCWRLSHHPLTVCRKHAIPGQT